MKYLLASDYDGTLKCGPKVSNENIEAIKEFRAKGNLFGVVTGRGYIDDCCEYLDFTIGCNGAIAYDKDFKVLFSEKVDGSKKWQDSTFATQLIKRLLQLTNSPCGISVSKNEGYVFHPDCLDGGVIAGVTYSPLSVLDNVVEFNQANTICENDIAAAKTVLQLRKEFGEYLNPTQNGRCIDIPPRNINKANGIERLAECFKIPKDCIFTVGDNFNDMSMVATFHGCAMSHGVEELKKSAEHTCDSVADFIEIILKKQGE